MLDVTGRRPSEVLTVETRAMVREIFGSHGAVDVCIFGSTARGSDRPGSDLDLLAAFPPGFTLLQLMALEEDVEKSLGIPVDVVSDFEDSLTVRRARVEAVPL